MTQPISQSPLNGLKGGQEKMSRSYPDSAGIIEDAAEDVEQKIANAYCPSKEESLSTTKAEDVGKLTVDMLNNSRLDYVQTIIISLPGATSTADKIACTDRLLQTVPLIFLHARTQRNSLTWSISSRRKHCTRQWKRRFQSSTCLPREKHLPAVKSFLLRCRLGLHCHCSDTPQIERTKRCVSFRLHCWGDELLRCHLRSTPSLATNSF